MANLVASLLTLRRLPCSKYTLCTMAWRTTEDATRHLMHGFQLLTLAFEALRRTESMPPMVFRKVS